MDKWITRRTLEAKDPEEKVYGERGMDLGKSVGTKNAREGKKKEAEAITMEQGS